jgi:hypothetical protein
LYWTFDRVAADGGSTVFDESGHGNHGTLGDMPSVSEFITFSTNDAAARPTTPRLLRASAPSVVGGGVVDVWVPVGAQQVTVNLTALDDEGSGALTFHVESLPAHGVLSWVAGGAVGALPATVVDAGADPRGPHRIVFAPGAGFAAAGSDSFAYSVTNGTATALGRVNLALAHNRGPAVDVNYSTFENVAVFVHLGDVDDNGDVMQAALLTEPGAGDLRQMLPGPYSNTFAYLSDATVLPMAPSLGSGALAGGPSVPLVFRPAVYEHATAYASFSYSLVSSSVGVVDNDAVHWAAFAVSPMNVAPVPTDVPVYLGAALSGNVTLNATDYDGSLLGRIQFRVTSFPTAGTLREADGTPLEGGTGVNVMELYASAAMNASSVYNDCGGDCW